MARSILWLALAVFMSCTAIIPGIADAQESLTVTFDTTEAGGRYAPKNALVVWIENASGGFVKTIGRWCNNRCRYLLAWNAASGGSSVDVDAISGASLSSHGTRMVTWDMRNRAGTVVADGVYTIRMELADQNATSTSQLNEGTFSFNKNGTASTQMTSGGGFNSVRIIYTGRACSPMCSGRMCGADGCGGSCGTCTGGRSCSASYTCVCPTGRTFCSGTCVDTDADPMNCGGCGTACTGGRTCNGSGMCTCPGSGTFCSGACVDTNTDTAHCGGCGASCGGGEFCSGGTCGSTCTPDCTGRVCGTDGCTGTCGTCSGGRSCAAGTCVCPAGETFCSGACVDTNTSTAHCGGCGVACTGGDSCAGGACVTVCTPDCAGRMCGSDGCGANCGLCPTGRICDASGSCDCPAGLSLCSGTCVDVNIDTAHCGGCGMSCGAEEFCVTGACSTTCAPACSGRDCGPDSCMGSCGTCPSDQTCDAEGTCNCPAGTTDCGLCIDTDTHPLHCGGCGMPCAPAQRCVEGACMGIGPTPDGGGTAIDGGAVTSPTEESGCGCSVLGADQRGPHGAFAFLLLVLGLARSNRRRQRT